ncbi:ABC transporter substrate-binding protein [Rhodoferax sp.]|uniref:ABC transporter substrate-binding protein n=1 Tax=Rhodoferax sp. TaxID=50421 RepID=UPI002851298B|nr:ABC transporter substrate-binding protein [Rhodoferax sp.]MDR3371427.1 ABC transporter substrate-binding protein [Rhodoferax sp.]
MKLSHMATAVALVVAGSAAMAGEVEVLHWWTSGGEAKSVGELKKIMQAKGDTWKDFAVAGGGGDNAMTVLKSRVVAGNPPAAAQIKGPAIQEWAAEGVLANLDPIAKAEKWDSLLPKAVADGMKYKGNYVAVPVNVHRVNWMWASSDVLKKSGVKSMPTTWDQFFADADKIKKAGFIPVATGGNAWNDFTTFEPVALGVGGVKFYNDAFVKLDPKALNSPAMKKSLETFRKLKGYIDQGAVGRDWNLATAMVIQGKAGFQFMGDWAKGEFVAAGKVPGKDFLCAAAPGNAGSYTFNVDSFAMFKLKDAAAQKAQADLAVAIMSPEFQEIFNLNKGSIPVRLNMDMSKFDDCAKLSAKEFVETAKSGGLVPSVSQDMALKPAMTGALKDVVSQFWNDDKMTPETAMTNMVKATSNQ